MKLAGFHANRFGPQKGRIDPDTMRFPKITTHLSNPGRRRRDHAGFTLIEIIVVIGAAAILAAIAYPTLGKWVPNYQLKAAARELHGQLQRGKLHAVKINDPVLLTVTAAAPCPGGSYSMAEKTSGTAVLGGTVREGVCISASTVNNGTSGFSPQGLPANNNGFTITLTHVKAPGRTYTLTQSLSGSIRIQ